MLFISEGKQPKKSLPGCENHPQPPSPGVLLTPQCRQSQPAPGFAVRTGVLQLPMLRGWPAGCSAREQVERAPRCASPGKRS